MDISISGMARKAANKRNHERGSKIDVKKYGMASWQA